MKAIIPQELCLSFQLLYAVLPYLVGPLRPTRTAICFRHIGRNTLFVASRPSLTDATQLWLEDDELPFSLYLCVKVLNKVSDRSGSRPLFFSTVKCGKEIAALKGFESNILFKKTLFEILKMQKNLNIIGVYTESTDLTFKVFKTIIHLVTLSF
jgi:hypothetical protein